MSTSHAAIRTSRRILRVLLVLLAALTLATIVLGRVLPAMSGGATFVVRGGSMEPAIPLGSALIVTPVAPASLRTGDIVTVQVTPETLVYTHRIDRVVSRADGLWIQTKGDANATPDASLIPATAVIGRASVWIPIVGGLVADLASALGMALIVSCALSLLAVDWLLESLEETAATRRIRPAIDGAPGLETLAGSKLAA